MPQSSRSRIHSYTSSRMAGVGPVLAGAAAGRVIRHDVLRGEFLPIVGPQRPVAEGLASLHLPEYRSHVAHGPAQFGRPDAAAVELRAPPDVLPVDGDQYSRPLLIHGTHFLPCRSSATPTIA